MRKLLWSFPDAGMKLVYLIFCDDMVLNEKKKKQQKKQQQKKKQKKKTTLQWHVCDREVYIKAKHGC